jgi:hypothetical protein
MRTSTKYRSIFAQLGWSTGDADRTLRSRLRSWEQSDAFHLRRADAPSLARIGVD